MLLCNSIKIKRDFKGVYFKNVPITIKAEPKHDYEFVGWQGRNDRTPELTILLTEDIDLIPIFTKKNAVLLQIVFYLMRFVFISKILTQRVIGLSYIIILKKT